MPHDPPPLSDPARRAWTAGGNDDITDALSRMAAMHSQGTILGNGTSNQTAKAGMRDALESYFGPRLPLPELPAHTTAPGLGGQLHAMLAAYNAMATANQALQAVSGHWAITDADIPPWLKQRTADALDLLSSAMGTAHNNDQYELVRRPPVPESPLTGKDAK